MDGTLLIKQISICPVFFSLNSISKIQKINFNNTVFNFDVVNKRFWKFYLLFFLYNSLSVNYDI
jgi:hypothetical protein